MTLDVVDLSFFLVSTSQVCMYLCYRITGMYRHQHSPNMHNTPMLACGSHKTAVQQKWNLASNSLDSA